MHIYTINDLSNVKVVNILKNGLSEISNPQIIKNYHPDYTDFTGNLFYILEYGRYKRGNYFVIADEHDNFIASAGWNQYEDDPLIALICTRMYVNTKYRTQYYVGNYILPKILEEVKEYKHAWVTWNNHNDAISKWFDRSLEGRSAALFNNWPEIYKKFKPIGKKIIYHTEQNVAEFTRT
jgi:hypothetical protein